MEQPAVLHSVQSPISDDSADYFWPDWRADHPGMAGSFVLCRVGHSPKYLVGDTTSLVSLNFVDSSNAKHFVLMSDLMPGRMLQWQSAGARPKSKS